MKEWICTAVGVVGAGIASVFGGWDLALSTPIIFMAIDYITGLVVAGVFHNSRKTDTGALESRAGFKGLCRKGMTLVFVLIGYRMDLLINTNYIRDAIIIGFTANEAISIVESAGYNYSEVQKKVNELCGTSSVDYTAIAKEVIAGEWGNGNTRKSKLTAAGYDYAKVQARVNELLS